MRLSAIAEYYTNGAARCDVLSRADIAYFRECKYKSQKSVIFSSNQRSELRGKV